MSWYALSTALVQRLKGDAWGTKIEMPDGTRRDTAVQPAIDTLIAGLVSQDPIPLNGPLQLNAVQNGPSIIINRIVGDPNEHTWGDPPPNIDNGFIRFKDQNGNVIDFPGTNGNIVNITNSDGSSGTTGFTGSVVVVTNATFSASSSIVGCVVTTTVTPTFTTKTMNFQNGLLISVS